MWQNRRVVWSKDRIYFARIGEETIFDSIPLSEVRGVEKVEEAPAVSGSAPSARLRRTRSVGTPSPPHLLNTLARGRDIRHRCLIPLGPMHNMLQAAGGIARPPSTSAPAPDGAGAGAEPGEPAAPALPARTRIVEVRAAAARNLPRMDAFGTCDAFCRITLCGETRETAVRGGGRPHLCDIMMRICARPQPT